MSERGSFVTQYVYCKKCFEAAKKVLLSKEKYLCSTIILGLDEVSELPIIAGKVGGLSRGEELLTFEFGFNEKLEKVLCHPMRIAVLAECGERIFTVIPNETKSA